MVLKTEVRRLEKMIGRDNTNVEYLKNILLKVSIVYVILAVVCQLPISCSSSVPAVTPIFLFLVLF